MSTYYIGADVHSNSTELAIEKRGKIVAKSSYLASRVSYFAIIPPAAPVPPAPPQFPTLNSKFELRATFYSLLCSPLSVLISGKVILF